MNERFIRDKGKLFNMDDTFINRSFAEHMDNHQMDMYTLLKEIFPNAKGYEATAYENDDGSITTKFNILIDKEEK